MSENCACRSIQRKPSETDYSAVVSSPQCARTLLYVYYKMKAFIWSHKSVYNPQQWRLSVLRIIFPFLNFCNHHTSSRPDVSRMALTSALFHFPAATTVVIATLPLRDAQSLIHFFFYPRSVDWLITLLWESKSLFAFLLLYLGVKIHYVVLWLYRCSSLLSLFETLLYWHLLVIMLISNMHSYNNND